MGQSGAEASCTQRRWAVCIYCYRWVIGNLAAQWLGLPLEGLGWRSDCQWQHIRWRELLCGDGFPLSGMSSVALLLGCKRIARVLLQQRPWIWPGQVSENRAVPSPGSVSVFSWNFDCLQHCVALCLNIGLVLCNEFLERSGRPFTYYETCGQSRQRMAGQLPSNRCFLGACISTCRHKFYFPRGGRLDASLTVGAALARPRSSLTWLARHSLLQYSEVLLKSKSTLQRQASHMMISGWKSAWRTERVRRWSAETLAAFDDHCFWWAFAQHARMPRAHPRSLHDVHIQAALTMLAGTLRNSRGQGRAILDKFEEAFAGLGSVVDDSAPLPIVGMVHEFFVLAARPSPGLLIPPPCDLPKTHMDFELICKSFVCIAQPKSNPSPPFLE